MTDTPAPVAQPLSDPELRAIRSGHTVGTLHPDLTRCGEFCPTAQWLATLDRERRFSKAVYDVAYGPFDAIPTDDAARSVPDNAALREADLIVALDSLVPGAYIGDVTPEMLKWRTCWVRVSSLAARLAAAPASPAGLDVLVRQAFMDGYANGRTTPEGAERNALVIADQYMQHPATRARLAALDAARPVADAAPGAPQGDKSGENPAPGVPDNAALRRAAQALVDAWVDDESGMEPFDPAYIDRLALALAAAPASPSTCVDCGGDHPSGHPWHTPPAPASPAGLDVERGCEQHPGMDAPGCHACWMANHHVHDARYIGCKGCLALASPADPDHCEVHKAYDGECSACRAYASSPADPEEAGR